MTKIQYKACMPEETDTAQRRQRAINRSASHNRQSDSENEPETVIRHCVVKLDDIYKKSDSLVSARSFTHTRQSLNSFDSLRTYSYTTSGDTQYRVANECELTTSYNEPALSELSETKPSLSGNRVKTHTHKKSFICDICRRMFSRKDKLVCHRQTHTKTYSCELCSYKSALNNNLTRHMKIHTGEKPYCCKLCNYKSSRRGSLVVHMSTHTGEKPFSCTFCPYKSADKSTLRRHTRTHTGEMPYSCKCCSYKCVNSSHLVRHMKTHTLKS